MDNMQIVTGGRILSNSKVEEEGGEQDHSSQSYQLTSTGLTTTLCLQRKLRYIAVPLYGLFCPSAGLGTTMLSKPLQPVLCLIGHRQPQECTILGKLEIFYVKPSDFTLTFTSVGT